MHHLCSFSVHKSIILSQKELFDRIYLIWYFIFSLKSCMKKRTLQLKKSYRNYFSSEQTLKTTKIRISICEDLQDNENHWANSENLEQFWTFRFCSEVSHSNVCTSENIFLKKMFEKMDSPILWKEISVLGVMESG